MNYLEVVIFGLTIVFCLSIIQYPDTSPSYFQWEVGCYVVVFAWYNMLMSLKKLPLIGIYVLMIKILLESFIKVMLPIFLFLIPYILMFHMSFPETETFKGIGTSIGKVVTMFTGQSLSFETYFVAANSAIPDFIHPVQYPYSTYPLYMMFLFLCPIILMNLLTVLAILDVAETRITSKLRRSAERIEQIFRAEKIVGKLSFCGVFAVSRYPHGKVYPNKVVYPLSLFFCFGKTVYDFKGSHVVEIVSRRRQVDGDGELRLKKIQGQVIRIITALNQLSAKIDVNTMQVDKNVNSEEIEIRKSRIIDTESGPA
ncbi:transient receptor potential cation channel subfamily A member 1-like [Bolinopsis microptera]|uniref:transient receptor potential cation channel subfamily A member 1-like n=1 Tax=Bolinopsis microptera TaxID=2820187 RepID=UPI003079DF59